MMRISSNRRTSYRLAERGEKGQSNLSILRYSLNKWGHPPSRSSGAAGQAHGCRQATRLSWLLRLQHLDGVAQFRRAFIKLFRNRGFHLTLHDFQFRARTFRFHFLEPFLEKCDLRALRYEFGKI